MANSHSKSFFGRDSGMIIRSSNKNEPFIFIQCIKRKGNGYWEKRSRGEGKIIKLSLEEIAMFLKVLRNEVEGWSTYHSYNNENTPISVKTQSNILWINIGQYSKKLNVAESEIMELLLTHLLSEKIEFATQIQMNGDQSTRNIATLSAQSELEGSNANNDTYLSSNGVVVVGKEHISPPPPSLKTQSAQNVPNGVAQIKGKIIRKTQKALLIDFFNNKETWIPKSTIHSTLQEDTNLIQSFLIDEWVLKKNSVIS